MPKRNVAWLALLCAAGLACAFLLPGREPRFARDGSGGRLEALRKVLAELDRRHVTALDDETVRRFLEGAVHGGVNAIGDGYCQYYTPEEAAEFFAQLQGRFTGVGLELEMRDGAVTVVSAVESSPASAAGIFPGDQVIRVNGRNTERMTVPEVVRLIRGEPGTKVSVKVRRPDVGELPPFALYCSRIVLNPVKGFLPRDGGWDYVIRPPPGGKLGYVRVSDFIENEEVTTMGRFNAAMTQLQSEGATGLIIDLRGNAGGIFGQAIEMVDRFVSDGIIVTERSVHGETVHRASGPGTLTDWPIVVLVNDGSASAAEVVAGSLAMNRRAVLVGERTYGKGTKQETIELDGVGGGKAVLKHTVAYLYLPGGRDGWAFDQSPPGRPRRSPGASERHPGGIAPTLAVPMAGAERLAVVHCRRRLDCPDEPLPTATQPASGQPLPSGIYLASMPATAPDAPLSQEELARRLLKLDRQLAAAIEVLSDPARYKTLLLKAPTTAPEAEP